MLALVPTRRGLILNAKTWVEKVFVNGEMVSLKK